MQWCSMATELCSQFLMYLGFLFIIFNISVRSMKICNLKVDEAIDQDIHESSPCSKKYLTNYYFQNHDNVLDSDLQGLLVEKLPIGSCKALPQSSSSMIRPLHYQQNLLGEGSHRHLFLSIKFNTELNAINELPMHFCQVIAVVELPTGVFADPFELQHLVQRGAFADAAVFGDTNLELPSALSDPSIVEIHVDIGLNILSNQKKELKVDIELPLHARYPLLDRSGYSTIEIAIPSLFMRCRVEEMSQIDSCLWMILPNSTSNIGTVSWKIPSGNDEHSTLVSFLTFASALSSMFLIVFATVCYPNAVNFGGTKKQA